MGQQRYPAFQHESHRPRRQPPVQDAEPAFAYRYEGCVHCLRYLVCDGGAGVAWSGTTEDAECG